MDPVNVDMDFLPIPMPAATAARGPRCAAGLSALPGRPAIARWRRSPESPCRSCAARSSRRRACRSEEHTSELQSLRHLVCRLLLEKKQNPSGGPKLAFSLGRSKMALWFVVVLAAYNFCWMVTGDFVFFFNDTATTEIYTLSLHDALPIYGHQRKVQFRSHDPALRGGGP